MFSTSTFDWARLPTPLRNCGYRLLRCAKRRLRVWVTKPILAFQVPVFIGFLYQNSVSIAFPHIRTGRHTTGFTTDTTAGLPTKWPVESRVYETPVRITELSWQNLVNCLQFTYLRSKYFPKHFIRYTGPAVHQMLQKHFRCWTEWRSSRLPTL
jgi:hypothetical protein